jgi:phenylpyruvate tautomerase PptA (4-oxalocrotonate tautomerase family)
MPLLQINTNASCDDHNAALKAASKTIADMLGKPESYVMVVLNTGMHMRFAGSDEPCAHLKLKSLGLDESATAEYSAQLCLLVDSLLGIAPSRTYIEFAGPPRHMWGWDNHTF